ncbi:hypothetical protein B0H16DRAFT_1683488 [Mycena metata]|uniref:Uncharacterized protein n=1 Tax=Mycena metata TaxID=1033252 RepID=A0AAD7K8Z0_9AGAR|nr:hypothetical protein B0H16DRAFT_1683488 [Mycena metata]
MIVSGLCTHSPLAILLRIICVQIVLQVPLYKATQAASIHTFFAKDKAYTAAKRDSSSDNGLSSASPPGRSAASATIWMTAVNEFTLWVNGQPIGSSGPNADDVQLFSVALNGSINTFSVLAVNQGNPGAPPPGLVAAIQIEYSDGSNEFLLSNGTWAVSPVIPSDFPVPGPADTANFAFATVLGPFGSAPWGNISLIPAYISPSGILLGSTWIWSNSSGVTLAAPVGIVGFRRAIITPTGKNAQTASVLITADDKFTLYFNGNYVGAPPQTSLSLFKQVQKFTLDVSATPNNTFTVFVNNLHGHAGLVAAITIQYSDGSSQVVSTDADWLTGPFTSVSTFFSQPDSALSATFALGTMGISPWEEMVGIHDVLAASAVPTSPFASGTLPPTMQASSDVHPSSSAVGPSRSSTPTGLIVGPIVGGLVFILTIGFVLLFWRCRRRRQRTRDVLSSEPFNPEGDASHPALPQWRAEMGSTQTGFISGLKRGGGNRGGNGNGQLRGENSEELPIFSNTETHKFPRFNFEFNGYVRSISKAAIKVAHPSHPNIYLIELHLYQAEVRLERFEVIFNGGLYSRLHKSFLPQLEFPQRLSGWNNLECEAYTNFYRAASGVIYSVHAVVGIKGQKLQCIPADSASGVHSAWPGISGKPSNNWTPTTAWARTPTDMALGNREINVFRLAAFGKSHNL